MPSGAGAARSPSPAGTLDLGCQFSASAGRAVEAHGLHSAGGAPLAQLMRNMFDANPGRLSVQCQEPEAECKILGDREGEDLSGLKLYALKMRHPPWLSIDNKVVLLGSLVGAVGAVVAAVVTVIAPFLLPKAPSPGGSGRPGVSSVTPSASAVRRHQGQATIKPVSGSKDGSSSSGLDGQPKVSRRRTLTSPVPSSQPSVTPSSTYPETAGGPTHTWTNYIDAGGIEGATISTDTTVRVSCRTRGFEVQDGDIWWYRIASSPWRDSFYASADAFFNNGITSGSLVGAPYVDTKVPVC
jgi:hypothetical protein